jgi:alpha-L-fucosidase 2
MLLQSHNNVIRLIPAVPAQWSRGEVKGLCARGGFVIDMTWNDNNLIEAIVSSEKGGRCLINYKDKQQELTLAAGEKKILQFGPL